MLQGGKKRQGLRKALNIQKVNYNAEQLRAAYKKYLSPLMLLANERKSLLYSESMPLCCAPMVLSSVS